MIRRHVGLVALCLALALTLALAAPLAAQQKDKQAKPVQYAGRITVLSKTTSAITIQAKTGIMQIAYDSKTQFTYRNKPGSIDDLKEGRRVVCVVNPAEKGRLLAVRIDVREGK